MRNAAAWCAPFAFAPGLVMRSRGLGNGSRILSAFPELTGNRFCTKKAISLTPAGGLSVFCLHSGAVFKIVFRGRKICALYFKICLTYFEICRTYFLFAPTWGLRAENQFSFFRAKKCRFSIPVSCGFIVCVTCGKEREKRPCALMSVHGLLLALRRMPLAASYHWSSGSGPL